MSQTELRAFHGNGLKPADLKRALVREMEKHRRADEIIKGTYGEQNGSFKACSVGCSIHSLNTLQGKSRPTSDHAVFEQIGIPQPLAHLQDRIFESLPEGKNSAFAVAFWEAIPDGADLSKVTAKFLVWCLLDKKHGAIRQTPADKFKDCHDAILACALLWKNYIKTGKHDESAAWSAARAAWSAARAAGSAESAGSAAWSARAARAAWSAARAAGSAESAGSAAWSAARAAWTAAGSAAWSAARSAESAWSAAWSAARSAESARAAWSAAWSARAAGSAAYAGFWKAAAETLLKLLEKAPISSVAQS